MNKKLLLWVLVFFSALLVSQAILTNDPYVLRFDDVSTVDSFFQAGFNDTPLNNTHGSLLEYATDGDSSTCVEAGRTENGYIFSNFTIPQNFSHINITVDLDYGAGFQELTYYNGTDWTDLLQGDFSNCYNFAASYQCNQSIHNDTLDLDVLQLRETVSESDLSSVQLCELAVTATSDTIAYISTDSVTSVNLTIPTNFHFNSTFLRISPFGFPNYINNDFADNETNVSGGGTWTHPENGTDEDWFTLAEAEAGPAGYGFQYAAPEGATDGLVQTKFNNIYNNVSIIDNQAGCWNDGHIRFDVSAVNDVSLDIGCLDGEILQSLYSDNTGDDFYEVGIFWILENGTITNLTVGNLTNPIAWNYSSDSSLLLPIQFQSHWNTFIFNYSNGSQMVLPLFFQTDGHSNLSIELYETDITNYTANLTFRDNETNDNIFPACTLDGESINHSGVYSTYSVNKEATMQCVLNGYAHYTRVWNVFTPMYEFFNMTSHVFNVEFRDELTDLLLTGFNITAEFINDQYSVNDTTDNGLISVPLSSAGDYTVRYFSTDYGSPRHYYFTLTNQSYTNVTLYLLNNTLATDITVNVFDKETIVGIQGATIHLLRYDLATNTYVEISAYSSDVGGKAYFQVEASNELYQFVVDYPFGETKLTTEPLYLEETTYNLYIDTGTSYGQDLFYETSIIYSLTYDNSTNQFSVTYTDPSIIASQYCLTIKRHGTYSLDTLNSSCGTSTTGTITIGGLENNTVNYGVFSATINGEDRVIASIWKELYSDNLPSGKFGLFMAGLILITFVLLFKVPELSLIIGGGSLVLLRFLGLIDISWSWSIGVWVFSIVLTLMVFLKR